MTLLLFAAGAAAAALGTRLAALAFVGAAVTAARSPDLVIVGTWTAALAAGWLLLTRSDIRRLAIPALGAAAVLAAGTAPNGAVVGALWVIATAAAVIARGTSPAAGRWAAALLIGDVGVLAAIATTVPNGFEGWPSTLGAEGTIVLLVVAAIRVPLASGADDREPLAGLLIVRTQCAVLLSFVVAAGTSGVRHAVALVAAAAFASAPYVFRRATADSVQELAVFALALAVGALGWGPQGWAWSALAAGTLMHYLRFSVGRGVASGYAQALGRTAAIGLPWLPVVLALLEGSLRSRGLPAAAVAAGLLGGLAARARAIGPALAHGRPRGPVPVLDEVRAWTVVALVVAAALWAPVFTLPPSVGGTRVGWPPAWAVAVVALAVVAAGTFLRLLGTPSLVGSARPQPVQVRPPSAVISAAGRLDVLAPQLRLLIGVGALGAGAAALWLVGVARGFL